MKRWNVNWTVSVEYLINFQAQEPFSDIAWVYAPHHASFPKDKVFECVEAQSRHFDAIDIFCIDGQEFTGFNDLITYLRRVK